MSSDEEFLKEIQQDFLSEAKSLMDQYEQYFLELDQPDSDRTALLNEIFRVAHSIKGAAAATAFEDLSQFAHKVEDYLTQLRNHPEILDQAAVSLLLRAGDTIQQRLKTLLADPKSSFDYQKVEAELNARIENHRGESSTAHAPEPTSSGGDNPTVEPSEKLKVDAQKVEEMLALVGELVTLKSQLLHRKEVKETQPDETPTLRLLDKTIRELYDKTLSMRLTELSPLYLKSQRAVRDISLKLKKSVRFEGEGQQTQVDRVVVEALGDPIIHLIRNAMDHGLEHPEERLKAGKPEAGKITLTSRQKGSQVIVEVSDDGRGINREKIVGRCLELGLLSSQDQANSLSDTALYGFIFYPGFSTANQISDISGRGVGLDLVKEATDRLKGNIEIHSVPGEGTIFRMTLPLTTAISDGMVVSVNGYPYIIPIHVIREITSTTPGEAALDSSAPQVIAIRDRFIPYVDLSHTLSVGECPMDPKGHAGAWLDRKTVAVVETKGIQIALSVDSIVGQSQFVMKPLAEDFETIHGISGSAILGDGRIALVLDVDQFNPNQGTEVAA